MADSRGYSQIIRDIAATVPLSPGTNLVLNKYVTDVKHGQEGEHPIEVLAKDTETGEFLRLRARCKAVKKPSRRFHSARRRLLLGHSVLFVPI